MANLKRYQNTFKNFLNSLDTESANMPKPIDKGLCNVMPSFEDFSIEPILDKIILNMS